MRTATPQLIVLMSGALLLAAPGAAPAQPAPDLYAAAEGLAGQELKAALHGIVAGHEAVSQNATWEWLPLLERDPADEDRMILLYSRDSVPAGERTGLHREYLWPRSRGTARHPARSDLHAVFLAHRSVDLSRGSKPFDDCTSPCRSHELAPAARYDTDSWEPPDEVKGDVARALFYLAVRYEGEGDEPDLELVDGEVTAGCDCMGQLAALLRWHGADPVDERERRRNDIVDRQIQHNRNPFVDRPEWATAIWGAAPPGTQPTAAVPADHLDICSFNIQFLGLSAERDDAALAELVRDHDIVVVQELIAPPRDGTYPDGEAFAADPEARAFFAEMEARGFRHILSAEDTGTGASIHNTGFSTEWWVAFYDPATVQEAPDLPAGFLATDRSDHPCWERVPHAFPFRTRDGRLDFVLISVHLKPDSGPDERNRRRHELAAVGDWIATRQTDEEDFIILGDMNIQGPAELSRAIPERFVSLNDECRPTNTNPAGPRPYDHVLYVPQRTVEIDAGFDLQVVNLRDAMRPIWSGPGAYPGGDAQGQGYVHDTFRALYSDHHPVVFRLAVPAADDD